MSGQQFERSQQPLFSSEITKRAIQNIVGKNHIIVYCGAGVTIDRTGFGWKKLISSSIRPRKPGGAESYITDDDIESLPQLIDAQRLATILTGHCQARYPDKPDRQTQIHNMLRSELYQQSGWQSGTLATNIARYSTIAAKADSRVTLITTNYDVYLEKEIRKEIKYIKAQASKDPSSKVPTFDPVVIGANAPRSYPTANINLIYLHGKLPESAKPGLPIVVDELDYAETRSRTVEVLSRYLKLPSSAFVIVGASLTDPPLIEALALDANKRRNDPQYRVYVTPISSFGISNVDSPTMGRLVKHLESRCTRLGLDEMLTADFKFQTAQFFEELIVCTANGTTAYFKTNSTCAYGQRLSRWWTEWEAQAKELGSAIDANLKLLGKVREIAETYRNPGGSGEWFKLEIWARDKSQRELVIYASSIGIPMDRRTMKRAALKVKSNKASVRSLTEGRVMHLDATELGGSSTESFWKSFLAVPIYLDHTDVRLFAGVITLVSSSAKDQTAVPTSDVNKMRALVTDLTDLGATVLGSQTA